MNISFKFIYSMYDIVNSIVKFMLLFLFEINSNTCVSFFNLYFIHFFEYKYDKLIGLMLFLKKNTHIILFV
jgi:hypothetical protein